MLGQDGRFANQHARREGAENGVHADPVRDHRHADGDGQNDADDGHLADEGIVGPANEQRHDAPADGEAEENEQSGEREGADDAAEFDGAAGGEPGDDADENPGDGIVEDRGGENRLPDVAAEIAEIADDQRHDLHRRDGQRRAEEERGREPLLRIGQDRRRDGKPDQNAQRERHGDAGQRRGDGGTTDPPHQAEVGFHAGEKQEHEHAELGNGVEHSLLAGGIRKQRSLPRRPQQPEEGRPQEHPREELPHDGRLADALHGLARQTAGDDKNQDLREEKRLGRRGRGWRSRKHG